MQKKMRFFLLIVYFTISAIPMYAQQNSGGFLSPTSQASGGATNLGKAESLPVDPSTGAPSYDLPLYQLKLRDFYTIPFGLNYSTSGVQLDDMAGLAGTDWNLQGVFVIRRTIMDDPDEFAHDETKRLEGPYNADSLNMSISNGVTSGNDLQPDLFTLVTPDFTGKFFLRNDSAIFLNQNTPYVVTRLAAYGGFKVTDGQGNVLIYGGDAIEKTESETQCPLDGYVGDGVSYPTAWFLKMIATPFKDTVNFFYNSYSYTYPANLQITNYVTQTPYSVQGSCGCPTLANMECTLVNNVISYRLNYMKTNGFGKVSFDYINRPDNLGDYLCSAVNVWRSLPAGDSLIRKFTMDYSYGSGKKRPFLTKVCHRAGDLTDSLVWKMTYNNIATLPDRLVKQADGFGFYNASTTNININTGVSYYGTLAKIEYPTGGYDTLMYESNTYYTTVQVQHLTYIAQHTGYGLSDHSPQTYSTTATLRGVNGNVRISGYTQWKMAGAPDYPQHKMEVVFKNHNSGTTLSTTTVFPSQTSPFLTNLNNTDISTSGWFGPGDSVIVDCQMIVYGDQLYGEVYMQQNQYEGVLTTIPYGGVRIAKVKTVDNFGPPQVKTYNYNRFGTNRPSATVVAEPLFTEDMLIQTDCGPAATSICYKRLQQNRSMIDLFAYGNTLVYYSQVTESYGENMENGAIRYEYDLRLPSQPQVYLTALVTGQAPQLTAFNMGPFSIYRDPFAIEMSRSYLKKSGDTLKLVKKIDLQYTWIASPKGRAGYVTRRRVFPLSVIPSDVYKCYDMNKYTYTPSFFGPAGELATMYTDDNKQLAISTKYYYDFLPNNKNVSRVETINSEGDTSKILFTYGANLSGQVVYDSMKARNMITPIIDTKEYLNSQLLSDKKNNYVFSNTVKNLIVPANVSFQKGLNPMEERFTYVRYDTAANIIECGKANDLHEVYLYGYGGKLKVCRIIGTTYSKIAGMFNQAVLDNPASDQALRDEINKIRTGLAGSVAQVMTYTYSLMVGMTSETDLNNNTTYMFYDKLGNVQYIKNHDGKIIHVTDNEYNVPVTQ